MTREKIGRYNHKSPKFKESDGEDFEWKDLQKNQRHRKKLNKKSKSRTTLKEKW